MSLGSGLTHQAMLELNCLQGYFALWRALKSDLGEQVCISAYHAGSGIVWT